MGNLLTITGGNTSDAVTKETGNEVFVTWCVDMFHSGLVAELGVERFTTLMAITTYMDESGQCSPTQKQLANDLGVTIRTIHKYVKRLLAFRWNGQPIIQRNKYRIPGTLPVRSVYTLLSPLKITIAKEEIEPLSQTGKSVHNATSMDSHVPTRKTLPCKKNQENYIQINNITVEDKTLPVELKTVKDVLRYFNRKYYAVFGAFPSIDWARHGKLVKDKLMPIYTPGQLKQIVDVACEQYQKRWASPNFPRPTIGALVSWLAAQALAVAEENEKEQARLADAMSAPKHGGRDIDDILSKL